MVGKRIFGVCGHILDCLAEINPCLELLSSRKEHTGANLVFIRKGFSIVIGRNKT